jgi:hypothetical protein
MIMKVHKIRKREIKKKETLFYVAAELLDPSNNDK